MSNALIVRRKSTALPAHTTLKLLSSWQVSTKVRVSVDVHDLFNRIVHAGSWNSVYVIPGTGTGVVARLKIEL